ncbi:hypothetical protein R1sor_001701 [Riccia sorocarpa]|uniref:Reverse transcriptase domain-containing protein n=1 Tax=Riccia sorocarpa TaxID=122646 RepID=A0ABD3H0P2_9MARC
MVDHQGARTLSDHVPVSLELVLKAEGAARRPRRSYFKLDFRTFMRVEVLEKSKGVWQDHPSWAKDKRKRWTLALGRIRKLLMEVREDDRRKEEVYGGPEQRVETTRRRIEQDQSREAREEFEESVVAARRREQEQANQLRRRCKITWMKDGDAPSKYFFARLKAKHAHEELTALEGSSGEMIEDQEEILEEVHRFYQELYTAEEEPPEVLEKRRIVIGRIDKKLTPGDNTILEEVPTEELITRIVMDMPKEKSPGLDGVMVEILRIGWEFMKEECFQMVQGFWDKKKLVGKDNRWVIKLIPKNERKHLLQNWRPITLLTTTYKIIAKINLSSKAEEHAPKDYRLPADGDTIFVKLDFMKAYDRVAHNFLWDTLTEMWVEQDTLSRIKGLIEGGTSEVHVNGGFTEEIKMGRGVRQGCPLAHLLFAMTTQPLMRALQEEECRGGIQGLNIGGGRRLLHQLFADDTGICITADERQFNRLKEMIRDFEVASGASLNLQKSIVMQLRPGSTLRMVGAGGLRDRRSRE